MESSQKRILAAYALVFFGIGLTAKVIAAPEYTRSVMEEAYAKEIRSAKESETTGIICWYTGDENRAFFETCADDFREETGIAVTLEEQPSLNYFSEIYEAVKNDTKAPDVYLLEADELERAYLCQILKKNTSNEEYTAGIAENAVEAASRRGVLYGYPLYFWTVVFAYRTDYFETAPKSVQEMIDYSVEHEPGEGVEKLLEWDLSDGFCNFPFFGAALNFEKEDGGTVKWSYEKDTYEACQTFFGNLTAAIELDETAIGRKSVVNDFKNGKTVAVFLDSDDILQADGDNVEITGLPDLNEQLSMLPAAKTMLLCVNGMSENEAAAAEFAEYATAQESQKLPELTEHVPVRQEALATEEQKTAYFQYEKAAAEPDALNATDFWVKFQNEVLEIWNDAE